MRLLCVLLACALSCGAFVVASADTTPGIASASTGDSGGLLAWIADFISWLFVPPADYLQNQISQLSDKVNAKLGGLSYLYQMLQNFFTSLKNPGSASLGFTLPSGYWFQGSPGVSGNLMTSAAPYTSMVRTLSSVAIAIVTAMACYHKIRSFFSGGGE